MHREPDMHEKSIDKIIENNIGLLTVNINTRCKGVVVIFNDCFCVFYIYKSFHVLWKKCKLKFPIYLVNITFKNNILSYQTALLYCKFVFMYGVYICIYTFMHWTINREYIKDMTTLKSNSYTVKGKSKV